MNTAQLKTFCTQVRRDIIELTAASGSGHPGGSQSALELKSAIYCTQNPNDTSARATPPPAITAYWRIWASLTRRNLLISASSTGCSRATRT